MTPSELGFEVLRPGGFEVGRSRGKGAIDGGSSSEKQSHRGKLHRHIQAGTFPFIPVMEAVGEVIAIGKGVSTPKIGNYVGYAGYPIGGYSPEQILPSETIFPIPSSIDPITAASSLLKGMTVHMLVRRCFKLEPEGVGSMLCQWANSLGATVIGTVSTNEKAEQAKEDGCYHVVLYKEEDFVARVMDITGGEGVHVVL